MKASNICPYGFAGPLASGWVRGCRYMRIMLSGLLEFQIWIHAISQPTQGGTRDLKGLGVCGCVCVRMRICISNKMGVQGGRK